MHKLDERFDCFCVKAADRLFSIVSAMHKSAALKPLNILGYCALVDLQCIAHPIDVVGPLEEQKHDLDAMLVRERSKKDVIRVFEFCFHVLFMSYEINVTL